MTQPKPLDDRPCKAAEDLKPGDHVHLASLDAARRGTAEVRHLEPVGDGNFLVVVAGARTITVHGLRIVDLATDAELAAAELAGARSRLCEKLRQLADVIDREGLPVDPYAEFTMVLNRHDDLERWSEALATGIYGGGLRHDIPLLKAKFGCLKVHVQSQESSPGVPADELARHDDTADQS